jgi:hypothetical protein
VLVPLQGSEFVPKQFGPFLASDKYLNLVKQDSCETDLEIFGGDCSDMLESAQSGHYFRDLRIIMTLRQISIVLGVTFIA